ncbi:hypothetical protein MMYC01_200146 [Madurella mycetomatis]|uniref:Uncharacterized protein n=1 Tax=Madurella mycetomatis TaxID=100816 RepID=A0A150ATP8_9PEZI|nr:hypothetical protein MMYC01_200146 [Madurella mycetomatis]
MSLRRRPFLIFDKIQSKGYKDVKRKAPVKTPPPSQYRPGDGFSGREAKTIGVNLLTRNGKQVVWGPPIGVLDLTQSVPHVKQKRSSHRAGWDDNSFAPAHKTKKSRHSKPKTAEEDVNPPSHAVPLATRSTQTDNSVLREITSGTRAKRVPHRKDELHVKTTHSGANTQTRGDRSKRSFPQRTFDDNTYGGSHGTDTVAKSDYIWGSSDQHAGIAVERRDMSEKGFDSWPTHISDTPPHQLRAKSVPSESSDRQNHPRQSARVFRRFNTQ